MSNKNKYKVGDVVEIIHTDYESDKEYQIGLKCGVTDVLHHGLEIGSKQYFFNWSEIKKDNQPNPTNLQILSDKLHEYNQTNSTSWAILLCTPRTDEVFIVDEGDNQLSPEWWPNNNTGETIEKALELVPKEEKFKVEVHNAIGNEGWSAHVNQETKYKIINLMRGS